MKASPLLTAYRLASAGFGLTGPIYLYWRGKLGREDFSRRGERLGRPSLERPGGPLALLYAANTAQAAILPPLIEKLGQLGFSVVLATGNGAAGPFHAPRLPPSLHQLAPLDVPRFTARFLDHWQPDPALIRALLKRIDICLAQTKTDAGRFAKLGVREVQVTGNLKYDIAPPPVDQSALARLLARIGTRPVWVADGTYPGEEEIALAAHRRLTPQFPDLLTVIVPHNPKRGFEIAQSAVKMKLTVGRRSRNRAFAGNLYRPYKG